MKINRFSLQQSSIFNLFLQPKFTIKILGIALIPMIIISAVTIINEKNTIYNEKKMTLQNSSSIAYSIISDFYDRFESGQFNESEAKSQVFETISKLRYGPQHLDYFWIQETINQTPYMIMHPYYSELNGSNLSNYTTPDNQYLFNEAITIVLEPDETPGEGYLEYLWPYYNETNRVELKLSYLKQFEKWNWIIGTGIYTNDINDAIKAQLLQNLGIYSIIYLFLIIFLYFIFINEIKRRKILENSLKKSYKDYQELIRTMQEGLTMLDKSQMIQLVNPQLEEMLGYSSEELIGKPLTKFLTNDGKKIFQQEIQKRSKGINENYQVTWKTKEGNIITTIITPFGIFDENEGFLGSTGIVTDISDLVKITEELNLERELLTVTLRSLGEGVISIDNEGKIILINKMAEKLTGWQEIEAKSKKISQIMKLYDAQFKIPIDNLSKQIQNSSHYVIFSKEILLESKSGEKFNIFMTISPILNQQGKKQGNVIIFRDVSEIKRIEKIFFDTQRIESLGILAAGIAHDFNNFLTSILGNISLARMELGEKDKNLSELLNEAEIASENAQKLTNELLTFSIGGTPIKKTQNISEILTNSVKFALRGSNSIAEFYIQENLPPVDMDEGQISQVIQNLIINAIHAMPNGGTISIYAQKKIMNVKSQIPIKFGEYIEVIIQDEGSGIPREIQKHLFEPYFTTRENGHGLGLAVCYSILKNHDGYIGFDPNVSKGAKFYFLLPISKKTIELLDQSPYSIISGTGKILVLEDDINIQKMLEKMLGFLGYEAIIMNTGEKLLELYKNTPNPNDAFKLVILDLTIPGGLGGRETMLELRRINPQIKAIVSSGYSNDQVLVQYKKHGFLGYLIKPFTINELSDLLQLTSMDE